MPRLYVDASPRMIAYYLDGGGRGYQRLPQECSSTEAIYLAVIYGLTEYFNKWNKELDARQDTITLESQREADARSRVGESSNPFFSTSSPADRTARLLPPAVLILSDNEVVVKQLNKACDIKEVRLEKLAKAVWSMIKNVEVKIEWCLRKENLAEKMLP